MAAIEDLKKVLADVLQLGERAQRFGPATPLLGSLPELDSMAVVSVITGIEEHFGITLHDDEISASTFETLGSLTELVERKIQS